jgi:predicted naringenin-chalcone synthase
MEFDESKQEDPKYLIEYYKSRIEIWKNHPKGKKIVDRYKKAVERLSVNVC